ncbi:MAG: M48 family metallopeptidase [Gemmataceae bacterium]|nr:M48 family metallopeptidase [Gemmata sp.]MDW8198430.1 M48 family metallopeptidase [Gemmataceae bacterium]
MPLLLVFTLIAACLPVEWPEPPFDPPQWTALALTGSAVSLVLVAALVLRTWVIRTLAHDPERRKVVGRVYGQWRRVLFFVNLTTTVVSIVAFGWGWFVQHHLVIEWNGTVRLAPLAELLVPLPYFVLLVGCWLIDYDTERALQRSANTNRLFQSRGRFVGHNARQFALLVMIPVVLIVLQQTLSRWAPEVTHSDWYRVGSLAIVPVVLLLMPVVMKPLLGLQPMPAGPIRDQLEALARRLNFLCTDFLLWPTHGATANAMIAGLLPRLRYVVFTDRLLEELPPDELDAVFGHEIGHAKHGHIWLYAAFLLLSLSTLAALMLFLAQQIDGSGLLNQPGYEAWLEKYQTWLLLPPVAVIAVYLFVVFGALSRRCERQADIFGCKAVSCDNPRCTGHDATTRYPSGGRALCPTGIHTFARALARVGDLNGISLVLGEGQTTFGKFVRNVWAWMRAWQHATIAQRVAYLHRLADDLAAERRFQRRLFVFKWVLMLSLTAALIVLGQAVGWRELLAAM